MIMDELYNAVFCNAEYIPALYIGLNGSTTH